MKAALALAMIATVLGAALPTAVSAAPGMAILMHYRMPDGVLKPIVFFAPEGLSIRECRQSLRDALPRFKQQVANSRNSPEFIGAEYVDAQCERYSKDLVRQ